MPADKMKMYILVRESIPLGLAMTAVAHASAAAMGTWGNDPDFQCWEVMSFRKVICKVSDDEFERAKASVSGVERLVLTESALDGVDTVMVFFPKKEMPKMFKYLRLYK